MISLSFVNLYLVQKSEKVELHLSCIYKLSSDNKILSTLIKKAWCTCTFSKSLQGSNLVITTRPVSIE